VNSHTPLTTEELEREFGLLCTPQGSLHKSTPDTPTLRPYQQQVIERTRGALLSAAYRSVIIPVPTGGGKTVIAAALIKQEANAGGDVVVLVHRTELVDQMMEKLFAVGIDAGIIKAGYKPRPGQRVQVCSVQTLHARAIRAQRIEMPRATLVVVDECHHARARTWREILEALPDAKIVGLSATPARGDGRGLGNIFELIVESPQTNDLIDLGFLVGTRFYAPHDPDLRGVRTRAGDYIESQLAERMDQPQLVGDIVEHWLRLAARRATIAFCCSVGHSKSLRDEFRKTGVMAEHLDASTPADERKAILARLARGEVDVVCNCGILTEGFDAPNVGCIVLARPTKSTVLYRQMLGRGLRIAPGKEHCLVLDHSGAVFRQGFPEDRVEWTLREDKRTDVPAQSARSAHHAPALVTCPECQAVRLEGQPCSACGWRPQPKRQEVEVADGVLGLVDRDRTTRPETWSSGQKRQFWSELAWIVREKGWKPGAGLAMYRERFKAWPDSRIAPSPAMPSIATRQWVKSRMIAYARGRAAGRGAA
jgi:DNA repair protein RadD